MQRRPLAATDANLLVALDAILETESVAEAAKQLGVSASAASHALARLRELLSDPILVRAGRRMVATSKAKAIAPRLREGLSLVAAAIAPEAPFSPAEVSRELRIGAIDFALAQLLPRLFDLLRREAPGVDVLVRQYEPRSLDDLASGELDLVVALRRAAAGVRQLALAREAFVGVARRGHPALEGRMDAERFAGLPHVLVSSSLRRRGGVDDALERLGLSRRVALVLPSFASAALAVATSDMVLTGSRREAARVASHLRLVLFEPPVPLAPFTVSMFWHERTHGDPFLAWVRDRLAALARDDEGEGPISGGGDGARGRGTARASRRG